MHGSSLADHWARILRLWLRRGLYGLQSGAIDGQDNPLPNVQNMKFYEVMSQIVLTSHLVGFDVLTLKPENLEPGMSPQNRSFQSAADKAIAWSANEHLKPRRSWSQGFKKQVFEIYYSRCQGFPRFRSEDVLASDDAKEWAEGHAREDQRSEVIRVFAGRACGRRNIAVC